jgi:hypothetical protein
MFMKRFLLAFLTVFSLAACSKQSSTPVTPTPPPTSTKTTPSDSTLTVTMAPADGVILPTRQADTFLVRLSNPGAVNTVGLVYHVKTGSTVSVGHELTDSTWSDTADLSGNQVRQVKVTGADGNSKTWGVAFEYQVTLAAPMDSQTFVNCIYFTGDTMYVGAANGLYRSLDLGLTYSVVAGLGTEDVRSVVTSGSNIYVGADAGMFISTDGGSSFTEHVFLDPQPYGNFPADGVFKQADTLYVAAGNVDVSYDGGLSYVANDNGIGNLPIPPAVWCIYATGSTVYAGVYGGFAVSQDGGKSFTINSNGLSPGAQPEPQVNAMAIDGGTIYAATESGLGISTDGGQSFTMVTTTSGLGDNGLPAVAVGDSLLVAGSFGGLSLSRDGGNSFINFTTKNGIGGNWINALAIHKGVIYAGTFSGFTDAVMTMKPRAGG